jgi:hypothetical protein
MNLISLILYLLLIILLILFILNILQYSKKPFLPRSLRKRNLAINFDKLIQRDLKDKKNREIREELSQLYRKLIIRKLVDGEIMIGDEELESLKNLDNDSINAIKNNLADFDSASKIYTILVKILYQNLDRHK